MIIMRSIITSKNQVNYIQIITAFLIFLDIMPYFWWWTQSHTYVNYVLRLSICLLFWKSFSMSNTSRSKTGLMLLFVFSCILCVIRSYVFTLVLTIPLLFILFSSNRFTNGVYKYFITIYCIVVGAALIAWVLLLVGAINPIRTITPLNENEFDYYTVYPLFLVTHSFFDIQNAFRFSGPFDEPGVVGTFSALLLFSNSLDYRNWKTYVLLLSGIASFSLFFYVVLIIGLVPYIFEKRRIGSALFLVLAVGAFFIATKDNEVVERLIWDRLEWNSTEGRMSGSDRTNYDAERFYLSKRGTTDYWFGLDDYEQYRKMAQGSNSYQNVVMHYGMLFLISYVLFFVLYARKECKTKGSFLLFIFLFISCVYQRPQVLTCSYIFLYSCLARRESLGVLINNKHNDNGKVLNSSNDSYLQTV